MDVLDKAAGMCLFCSHRALGFASTAWEGRLLSRQGAGRGCWGGSSLARASHSRRWFRARLPVGLVSLQVCTEMSPSDILALSALIHVCLAQQSFSCLPTGQQPDLVQATSWRLSFQSQLPLWHQSDKFCEIVQAKVNLLHLEHSCLQKTLCYFLLLLSRQVTLVYVG